MHLRNRAARTINSAYTQTLAADVIFIYRHIVEIGHMEIIKSIQTRIYEIRGERVMLDRDLAALYETETMALNLAVKRNIERFPSDFMFQLTKEEWESLRLQFETSKTRGGDRYLPNVLV